MKTAYEPAIWISVFKVIWESNRNRDRPRTRESMNLELKWCIAAANQAAEVWHRLNEGAEEAARAKAKDSEKAPAESSNPTHGVDQ